MSQRIKTCPKGYKHVPKDINISQRIKKHVAKDRKHVPKNKKTCPNGYRTSFIWDIKHVPKDRKHVLRNIKQILYGL